MKFQSSPPKPSLNYIFLFIFTGIGVYIRYLLLESPITPYALTYKIKPNIDLGPLEIIFSKFHPELAHWRIIVSNYIYKLFGLSEITYRIFPFAISLATLYLIYKFTKQRIGENEAIISVLLFGVSYYSFWSIIWPHFPAFYFFASFLTLHFLWLGVEKKTGHTYWILFSFINFLNITNVILPFLFLPAVFLAGIWLIWANHNSTSKALTFSHYKKFFGYFFTSIAFALLFYQLKGLNIIRNAYELIINGKFIDPILAPIPGQEYFESNSSRLEKLITLGKKVFLTLNFYAGDMGVHGNAGAYVCFLGLFLLGQYRLFKNHRSVFIVFSIIIYPPIFLLSLGMNLAEERFLGFILPFYLISIAVGFCFLFSKILFFKASKNTKHATVFLSAFLLFTYSVHKKPVWSQNFLDNVFQTKGIATISQFLEKNLEKNDIILNVTKITELRGELGDALNLSSYEFYLEKFLDTNRLSLLSGKSGEVGIWLILQNPLNNKTGYSPFYFPPRFEPKLIKSSKGIFLYFDKINLPNLADPKNESFIKTPFWSFVTALYFHNQGNYTVAERYYQKMIKFGFNEERAYYNLGLISSKTNAEQGLNLFLKALQVLERPTVIPQKTEILSFLPRKTTSEGMIANTKDIKDSQPLKYYWQSIGQTKRKVWLKETLIPRSIEIYSQFYFTPAILSYIIFDLVRDESFFQLAKDLFTKGLRLNPYSLKAPFIKKLLIEKNRKISYKDQFEGISPLNLLGIHEHFPPIKHKG